MFVGPYTVLDSTGVQFSDPSLKSCSL